MKYYTRKQLSQELKINIETLRYYEKIKLIPPPPRAQNGYRLYSEEYLYLLNFIIIGKKYGFKLNELTNYLPFFQKTEVFQTEKIHEIVTTKINEINNKIQELNELKDALLSLNTAIETGTCNDFSFKDNYCNASKKNQTP